MLTRRTFLWLLGSGVAAVAAGPGAARLLSRRLAAPPPGAPAEPGAAPGALPQTGAAPGSAAPQPARLAAEPPRPFKVALLSDTHIQAAGADAARLVNPKLTQALADLKAWQPDLWLVNGDVTENGLPGEYAAFKALTAKALPREKLLVTTGNHEFYDMQQPDAVALKRFRDAFGLGTVYNSQVAGGIHFITLADEQWHSAPDHRDWAWLTDAQLTWFEQTLAAHPDTFTAVFLHQPLQETVASSTGPNPFGGSGKARELRAILARHPQVRLWLSGHTHRRIDMAGQVSTQADTSFVALGSTAYLLGPPAGSTGGVGRNYGLSQSRVLEIYPERVVVRARDHAAGKWLDDLTLSVPRRA